MPYIKEKARRKFLNYDEGYVSNLDAIGDHITNTGELNYVLTYLVQKYYYDHGMNYKAINDVLGAMEGAKLEFYRRIAAPYEDKKIVLNGDVY